MSEIPPAAVDGPNPSPNRGGSQPGPPRFEASEVIPPTSPGQQQGGPGRPGNRPLSPDDWSKLVETFGPIGKYLVETWRWKVEQDAKIEALRTRHAFQVMGLLLGFLGAVIALMAWLTYTGRVSGDALLFLVGTVSGVTLVMIQRYLFEAEPSEDATLL
jgi:hypothetical protein